MPNTKTQNQQPMFLTFNKPATFINFIIHGQCVFLFDTSKECELYFYTENHEDGIIMSLSEHRFLVTRIKKMDNYENQSSKNMRIVKKSGAYYWISIDSQNLLLQAGIGEARIETAYYKYQFSHNDKLWETNKLFLESITHIRIPNYVTPLRLLKNPITNSVPLFVKGTNEITMMDIAKNSCLPYSSLCSAAQCIYNCVSGENFKLDTDDFPDFSKAIEHSINTPGLWCNTRLKEKANEFGKIPRPLETYLRITLGQNNGESPGIPYVMEIWPVGHYSPIHNHGGSNAIIRVLRGNIHVKLYPYLCDDSEGVEPFAETEFKANDVTWLSPTLNQVHQLTNLDTNTQTCITIQCYLYSKNDILHYDYFDYIGDNNTKQHFEPDSDMDFVDFKNKMREEWNNRM